MISQELPDTIAECEMEIDRLRLSREKYLTSADYADTSTGRRMDLHYAAMLSQKIVELQDRIQLIRIRHEN